LLEAKSEPDSTFHGLGIQNRIVSMRLILHRFAERCCPLWERVSPLFKPLFTYVLSFWQTLGPARSVSNSFFSLDIEDANCFGAMLLSTFTIWFGTVLSGPFDSIICYWDGPNYVYAAITLYDIPHDNPWTKSFHYQPSYFACHLPGFPLLIRAWAFFTIGNYYLADILAILTSGLLLSYAFRRLLIAYRCVVRPTYTTILLAFVPMRLVIYHSVGSSEPLYMALTCLALVFFKLDRFTPMLICVWYCCITRIEGMAVGAAIGLSYLLSLRLFEALGMFLTFLAPFSMLLLHRAMFNDAFAYIKFNRDRQGLFGWPPFVEVLEGRASTTNAGYLHSFLDFYPFYVLGGLLVLPTAGPVGIFACGHLAYVAFLRHMDLFRYALPAAIFCVLIGYDRLWAHRIGYSACVAVAPLYILEMALYASGQIHSNRCWPEFLQETLDAAKDKLH
jgi:hypothetical protein